MRLICFVLLLFFRTYCEIGLLCFGDFFFSKINVNCFLFFGVHFGFLFLLYKSGLSCLLDETFALFIEFDWRS